MVLGKQRLLPGETVDLAIGNAKHRFYFSALDYSGGNNNSGATRSVISKPILCSQKSGKEAKSHRFPRAGFGDDANSKLFSG